MVKRGRELSASEAQNVLETTATRKTLMSWFDPFVPAMIQAIETRAKTVILDGRRFNVRKSENGKDHIFMVVGDFVPMTRVSLSSLNDRVPHDSTARS